MISITAPTPSPTPLTIASTQTGLNHPSQSSTSGTGTHPDTRNEENDIGNETIIISREPELEDELEAEGIRTVVEAQVEMEASSLSRNVSVISTNSSSSASTTSTSSSSSSLLVPPQRPRALRTYTGPQAKNIPDVLPASPTTPKAINRTFDDYLMGVAVGVGASSTPIPTSTTTHAHAFASASALPSPTQIQMANAIARGSSNFQLPSSLPVPGAGQLGITPASSIGINSVTGAADMGLSVSAPTSGISTPLRANVISGAQTTGNSTPILSGGRNRQQSGSNTPSNYRFEGVLGEGSYSTVYTATSLINQQVYAIKVLSKRQLQKENKVRYANSERSILSKLNMKGHPGVIRLYSAFQDANSLYFAFEIAPNGDLFALIRKNGSFTLRSTRYYVATILDAVTFIHGLEIIHRDLKPENILLDKDMKIKISDFGSAKDKSQSVAAPQEVTNSRRPVKGSFVGTAEYASPEMLVPPTITTRASDIWALGCIMYQLVLGRPPFKEATHYLTMQRVQKGDYSFPDLPIHPQAKEVIEGCLVVDPFHRATSQALREFGFFVAPSAFNPVETSTSSTPQPDSSEPATSSEPTHSDPSTDSTTTEEMGEPINWSTLWKMLPPKIESGLIKAPEENPDRSFADLKLTWSDLEGSEDEMEDQRVDRPRKSMGARHVPSETAEPFTMTTQAQAHDEDVKTPIQGPQRQVWEVATQNSGGDKTPDKDTFNTELMHNGYSWNQGSPSDYKSPRLEYRSSGNKRLSHSSDVPRRGQAGLSLPEEQIFHGEKSRRLSAPSGTSSRPRRISRGNTEDDVESVIGSGEGAPSTMDDEHYERTAGMRILATDPIHRDVEAIGNGHAKGTSVDSGLDTVLMSTSGTSAASRLSTTFPSSTGGTTTAGGSTGFELVRGVRGLDLQETDQQSIPDGLGSSLLLPDETIIHKSNVTKRVKRSLLPPKLRQRLLILTSNGRLLCIKEIKSTTAGKRKARLEDEVYLRPVDSINNGPPDTSSGANESKKESTSNVTQEPVTSTLTVDAPTTVGRRNGSASSNPSPSKRTSIIGITIPTGSSFSSALPSLNLNFSGSRSTSASNAVTTPAAVKEAWPQKHSSITSMSSTATTATDRTERTDKADQTDKADGLIGAATRVRSKSDTGISVYVGTRSSVYMLPSSADVETWLTAIEKFRAPAQ